MASGKENTENTTKNNSHQAAQETAKDNTKQTKKQDTGKDTRKPDGATKSAFDLAWDRLPSCEPKWPITRAERLEELEKMSPHYEKTDQRANLKAAKAWHVQFPPDEIVPEDTIYFVNGQKVDESGIDSHKGWVWEEGLVGGDYMSGHGSTTQHTLPPPGPAAAITENTKWTYYERAPQGTHMYQMKIELRADTSLGGNGQSRVFDVCSDSGAYALVMLRSDLATIDTACHQQLTAMLALKLGYYAATAPKKFSPGIIFPAGAILLAPCASSGGGGGP
ncbi:hypothetical protein PVAR5_4477 [Paecilomyces variotii No. 5]|uniref:Uncharacterized protein n=1 Tax=Byssochlamys spectabilis (strain No. 5 / NBRC 109023) TaxID=1356009 RepID=V5G1F4_BYSSN|nr:hypothetical protein PVAR5_4477 [Paecilomyces variotii No. 5]